MIDLLKSRSKGIALGGTLIIFFFFSIFGEKGLIKIYRIRKEISRIRDSKVLLEADNQVLQEDVRRMKHEKSYQERSARETLGFAKENEIIYEFSE